jgi:dTDP-4-dehydrorhamnose reductase
MKKKILVLGHKGMLGHMVAGYLEKDFTVVTLQYRWPELEFKKQIRNSDADVIVNCIGAIPQRVKDFKVNWELPIWLGTNFKGKVVHPSTDCEEDSDQYGVSKKKAFEWIVKESTNTKMIKASIIGPEVNRHSSFMYWFLNNEDNQEVNGYENHMWNGVTTYHWAIFCKELILNWDKYKTCTTLSSPCISKYEMCNIFNQVFGRKIIVKPFQTTIPVYTCLEGDIEVGDITSQLKQLIEYYGDPCSYKRLQDIFNDNQIIRSLQQ